MPQNESVAPYVTGAYPYFKDALQLAQKHGLYVILDLHGTLQFHGVRVGLSSSAGAPGSQNGYDNR